MVKKCIIAANLQ